MNRKYNTLNKQTGKSKKNKTNSNETNNKKNTNETKKTETKPNVYKWYSRFQKYYSSEYKNKQ
jgi:hypothetical protein